LKHPAFDLYIHLDKKTDMGPFEYLIDNQKVFKIENRTKIYWAGYGTIQATINGFREIVPRKYDYINVISAQDFPIKSAAYIYKYLLDHRGNEFIQTMTVDEEWKDVGSRIYNYHLINWQMPGRHRLENILNRLLPKRKFPMDHVVVGGANWFTLTNEAASYLLDFLDAHPRLVRYYKFCWGADEFIFSTILYNSDFRKNIRNNLIYVDWSGPKTGHPRILGAADLEKLKRSDKLFARKMDMDKDPEIFSLLEDWIQKNELTT
jgi:hypothetical protein